MSSGGVISIDCKKSMSKEDVKRVTEPGTMGVASNGKRFGSDDASFLLDFLFGLMNFRTPDIFFGGEAKLATDSEWTDASSSQLVDPAAATDCAVDPAVLHGLPTVHRSRCKNSDSVSEKLGKA